MTRVPEPFPIAPCPTGRGGNRQRRRATVAATLVAALLTAGCGSGNGSGAAPTTTTAGLEGTSGEASSSTMATDPGSEEATDEACDIVSDEVAAEVLGVSIVRREPHGGPGGQTVGCIKGSGRTEEPDDYFFVSVSVIADGAALVDEASGEPGSEPVAGLGDRSVYIDGAGALFIAAGTDVVQIQVHKGGETGSQQDCVMVATDVLERLA